MSDDSIKVRKSMIFEKSTPGANVQDGEIYRDISGDLIFQNKDNTVVLSNPTFDSGLGINYIALTGGKNHNFESGVTGYSAYANAAAAIPVDGTGGSPTVTITQNLAVPLRGLADGVITKDAVNRQGEGISYDFAIDDADHSKPLVISFDYSVSANFAINSGTAVDPSDVMVYIYDIDNATLIYPLLTGLDGSGRFVSSFQASASSTNYRLLFHIATVNALPWTMNIDSISIGPSAVVSLDGPITDWEDFTPTSTWTTNATQTGKMRRVGDSFEVDGHLTLSGATNASELILDLPAGLTIDTNKISSTTTREVVLGTCIVVGSSGTNYPGKISYLTSTTLLPVIYAEQDETNHRSKIDSMSSITSRPEPIGAGDGIHYRYKVPILGWQSGKTSAVALDSNRPVEFSAYLASPQSIPDITTTTVVYDTVVNDSHGNYNASTGEWTVPVSGRYDIKAGTGMASVSWTVGKQYTVYASVNSGPKRRLVNNIQSATAIIAKFFNGSVSLDLVAGDIVEIQVFHNQGGAVNTLSGESLLYVALEKTDTGSPLAALTEKVVARYVSNSGQIMTNGVATTVLFENKQKDTHGIYNISTGVITIPENGDYSLSAITRITGVTASTGEVALSITDGSDVTQVDGPQFTIPNSTQASANIQTVLYDAKAGDQFKVKLFHNNGADRSLYSVSNTRNSLSIFKIN